jgi:hypothetical protein
MDAKSVNNYCEVVVTRANTVAVKQEVAGNTATKFCRNEYIQDAKQFTERLDSQTCKAYKAAKSALLILLVVHK